MKKLTIAIDGYSSCGKSTMAKSLAVALGYTYVDTGAMYRAVTLYALRNGLFIDDNHVDELKLSEALAISVMPVIGCGGPEDKELRSLEVSSHVSVIAALPFVREALVARQREMGVEGGVVMDGRDIGTAVFPHAELKIFVTADPQVRAQRRYAEVKAKGGDANFDDILQNIEQRDYMDTHREVSPLTKAPDAILLDNSYMTIEEQHAWLLNKVAELLPPASSHPS